MHGESLQNSFFNEKKEDKLSTVSRFVCKTCVIFSVEENRRLCPRGMCGVCPRTAECVFV